MAFLSYPRWCGESRRQTPTAPATTSRRPCPPCSQITSITVAPLPERGRSCQRSSETPRPACGTSGCAIRQFSNSAENHSPPDLMTSSARSVRGDEALLVDAADVTGAQPAGIELGYVVPVIRASSQAHQTSTSPTALPSLGGTWPSSSVIRVSTPARTGWLVMECPMLVVRGARWRPGHGGQRRCFRHAPQLPNLDIVLVLEGTHQRFRNRHDPQATRPQCRDQGPSLGNA